MSLRVKLKAAALCVAAAITANSQVQAQALEEVVVTAQRRVQSLQDVPISLQVVNGAEMVRQGFRTVQDMSLFSPGLVIKNEEEEQGLMLRGAGTQSKGVGVEAAVPAFIDGIHFGRASSLKSAFLDVEQVEVLRGPQPVFFGQNATAGALNIRSKRPGDEWQGKAIAEMGNFGRQSIEGAVGGPVTETFGIRVAGKYDRFEGHLRDWLTGDKFPQQESQMLRGTVQWTPNEQFQATLKGEVSKFDHGPRAETIVRDKWPVAALTNPRSDDIFLIDKGIDAAFPSMANAEPGKVTNIGVKRGPLFLSPAGYTIANSANTGDVLDFRGCEPGVTFALSNEGTEGFHAPEALVNCEFEEASKADPWHAILNTTYKFANDIELESITGFSHHYHTTTRHAFGYVNSNLRFRQEWLDQWSQELRLTSPEGGVFEWMAGLYYQNGDLQYQVDGWRANYVDAIKASRSHEIAEWMSAFGTVTWNFMEDRASLDLGLRATRIEKQGNGQNTPAEYIVISPITGQPVRAPYGWNLQSTNASNLNTAFFGATSTDRALWQNVRIVGRGPYGQMSPGARIFPDRFAYVRNEITETQYDPQIVLRYRPNDDFSYYVKYATAFKAGGFDMSVAEVTPVDDRFVFGPESAETYEAGVRGNLLDGRARFDATLFWTNFDGLQVEFLQRNENSTVAINITQNIAAQRNRGLELSGTFQATDKLTLDAGVMLLDAEITNFPNSLCTETETLLGQCVNGVIDRSGQEPRQAPDWKGFFKTSYDLFTNETYNVNLDGTFSFSDGYITDRAWATVTKMDKEVDLNLSASVDIGEQWNVTFWGRNLFGSYRETYFPDNDPISTTSNTAVMFIQVPPNGFTSYGMQISYEFF